MELEFIYKGESTKQRVFTLSILTIIEAALVVFLFHVFNIEFTNAKVFIFLFVMSLLVLFMVMLNISSHNKLKKQKIKISKTNIIFLGLEDINDIEFHDIKKITVIRNRLNKVVQIVVKTKNKRLRIYGFENMDKILEVVQENKLPETECIDLNTKIIWKKPRGLVVIIMTLIFIAMLAIKFEFIRYVMMLIFTIVTFYMGILIMKGKLIIIHTGNKLEKLNKVYGFLIILLSFIGIIASILLLIFKIYIE